MLRQANWWVRLGELAKELVGKDFVWGETDCVTIARRALAAQFGEDPIVELTNVTYTTKGGATRAFNTLGSLGAMALKAGAREIPARRARDGDFLIFPKAEQTYENVASRMGGAWIIASLSIDKVVAVKHFNGAEDAEDVKAYRF